MNEKLPTHVVAIPDGNRRWAEKRNLKPWQGHRAGAKNLESILEVVRDLNLPCFTFWAASKNNILKRSDREVRLLLEVFRVYFTRLLKKKDIYELGVKVNFIGDWRQLFPDKVKEPMEKLIESTKKHNQRSLSFMVAYSGQDEMLQAVQKIGQKAREDNDFKITSDTIKQHLWTKELPPVDLIIRTGTEGDPHLSAGFMMWDTAEAQLHFTKTSWPDFGKTEFKKVLNNFSKRERRLGK